MNQENLVIKGARVNNLKNIDVSIPRGKLVIMTGLSGSGKTSLAFDTIYAEGQRRYVESLSSYARQFLGNMEKPDVDSIEGLSPAIAIDQKTTSHNPRSTVGTVTEIYDYLRLLYARIGVAYCPEHGVPIQSQTIKQMCEAVALYEEGSRLQILAPVAKNKKGTHKDLFDCLRKDGYVRVRVDKEVKLLEEEIELDKNKRHNIEVVVDRIIKRENFQSRLADSLETATKLADGEVIVENLSTGEEQLFSQNHACPICGFSVPKLEPRLFSFNSPLGACPHCNGLGVTNELDIDLLIPDFDLSINQGGIRFFKTAVGTDRIEWQRFQFLCNAYGIDYDKPLKDFTKKEMKIILEGSDRPISYEIVSSSGNVNRNTKFIEGVKTIIERRFVETTSKWSKEWYASFMGEHTCSVCNGQRLNDQVLSVRVGGLNIAQLTDLSIDAAIDFFHELQLTATQQQIAALILKEIKDRLGFLQNVGLGYLTLSRMAGTLSGGEAQRIRLATQIGSQLTGVLYVLDDTTPLNLNFLVKDVNILKSHEVDVNLSDFVLITLDCGDKGRICISDEIIESTKTLICIDHHASNDSFGDLNYINPKESSTCELVYNLLVEYEKSEKPRTFLARKDKICRFKISVFSIHSLFWSSVPILYAARPI